MNPELDMGQIEGGFMMGLGYHLTEKEKFDPTTGEVITDGTWVGIPTGTGVATNSKHWFTTSFLQGGRCRKAMPGVWGGYRVGIMV